MGLELSMSERFHPDVRLSEKSVSGALLVSNFVLSVCDTHFVVLAWDGISSLSCDAKLHSFVMEVLYMPRGLNAFWARGVLPLRVLDSKPRVCVQRRLVFLFNPDSF